MNINPIQKPLFFEIKNLIESSKNNVAVSVNAEMTMLYWQIGNRVNAEIDHREDIYGKKIVATLWRQLSNEYGNSFSEKNLHRMMQFAKVFPNEQIVSALRRQLNWLK